MKRLGIVAAVLVLTGCIAHMTPYGVTIEPLLDVVVTGPPVIVETPPAAVVQPLPPVAYVPDRYVYFYGGAYYYFWDGWWYWGRESRGPWHSLRRDYWPQRVERREYQRRERPHGGPGIERR